MRRVLIIEGERFLLRLLERRFERSGFQVLATSHAAQGLALARAYPPDLVILDRGVADVGGVPLDDHLREHPETAAVPVIVLGPRGVEAPPDLPPALDKPFSPNQLLALAHLYLYAAPRNQIFGIVPIS